MEPQNVDKQSNRIVKGDSLADGAEKTNRASWHEIPLDVKVGSRFPTAEDGLQWHPERAKSELSGDAYREITAVRRFILENTERIVGSHAELATAYGKTRPELLHDERIDYRFLIEEALQSLVREGSLELQISGDHGVYVKVGGVEQKQEEQPLTAIEIEPAPSEAEEPQVSIRVVSRQSPPPKKEKSNLSYFKNYIKTVGTGMGADVFR